MQTIGLIGGITPESTIMYYRILNTLASKHFKAENSAKVVMNCLDFGEVSSLQKDNNWEQLHQMMSEAGRQLEQAGAALILICANTMHLSIDVIRSSVSIPVIHIAEATAEKIIEQKISTVGLLGTKYTMEKDFFKNVLEGFGIKTLIPTLEDRNRIHDIIYKELSKGILNNTSKQVYLQIIEKLIDEGAEGIILGCTEIPLLIKQSDVLKPVFDTTTIHATKAFNTVLKL